MANHKKKVMQLEDTETSPLIVTAGELSIRVLHVPDSWTKIIIIKFKNDSTTWYILEELTQKNKELSTTHNLSDLAHI